MGLVVFGFGSWSLRAVAVERGEGLTVVGPSVSEPDVAIPNMPSFVGNPELKARLDLPGKLTVAGERVHHQLLQRFYAAHDYQTVWTSHPAEAESPVECSTARRQAWPRPDLVPQHYAHRTWDGAVTG